ncbi:MAG: 50S ribosomal protein L23 [Spirochaetaceae bacterium]
MSPEQIIIEPVLTEKTNALREQGQYVFRVNSRANKVQIKNAVRELFSVHPVRCNVENVKGKPKRARFHRGYTASWKKATVTLPAGESISAFEGV